MCGLYGIASQSINNTGKGIFEDLTIVSNLRGRHGAGVVSVHGDGNMRGVKSLYSGCDLLDMAAFKSLMGEAKTRILLGHTRYPTAGAADDTANVHPHFMENITGVHNGTLTHVKNARYDGKASDSFQFYNHASEVGFKEALASARGAYCFIFIDHKERTLNFIRNHERPLWFVKHLWDKDGQSLLWASEKEMLEFVLKRRKMEVGAEYVELPINQLWTLPYEIKRGDDFEVEVGVTSGDNFWRHVPRNVGGEREWPFRKQAKQGPASSVGKVSYVWSKEKRQFIEKSSVAEPKQVCLPRSDGANEPQGKPKVPASDGSSHSRGLPDEQRPKATSKVSLGNSGSAFLRHIVNGVEKHLSKDEKEFQEEIESEFLKLLEVKTSTNDDAPWEDSDPLVETMKGYWIPKRDYLMILQNGCVWTGDPASPDDDIYWIEKESFIFRHVLNDPEAVRDLQDVYPNDPYFMQMSSNRSRKDISPHHITVQ